MTLSPGQVFNPHRAFYGLWIPQWLEERREVSEKAKKLYAHLTFFAGGKGRAWPSYNTLAEKLHVSRRYIIQLIGELCSHRLIRVTHVDPSRGHRANVYEFLWHEWMQNETDHQFSMTVHKDTPGEAEFTSPSEPGITPPSELRSTTLVNPSSPKENNKKRINYKRIQVGRPITQPKAETASQPEKPTNQPPPTPSIGQEQWMAMLQEEHPDTDVEGELKSFLAHCNRTGRSANRHGFIGWIKKASPALRVPEPQPLYTY